MEILRLDRSHAEAYLQLRLEALQTNPEAFGSSYEETISMQNPVEHTASRLDQRENYTYGAFEDERLVGMLVLVPQTVEKMKHKASIFGMYVTPDYRGNGIARTLMEKAVQKARELEGIEQINLTVVTSNDSAKGLYSSLGFSSFGMEKRALKYKETYFDEEYLVLFL
ncbi:GNAT family N-acetyltransferase [Rossellomorea aquimaris]|uniref:GNAT family N-acetyltransferase n=1 Tax=Rossellomorea aquimaris TaxID=189382 RepID=UPI001CD1F2C2|nr:GNAT family N-acetyltransferase [Rossellomorea aquimaris]MCA1053796.1 GNAT family N-acetyltransferase [Rossellomorea aquimaris]